MESVIYAWERFNVKKRLRYNSWISCHLDDMTIIFDKINNDTITAVIHYRDLTPSEEYIIKRDGPCIGNSCSNK